MAVHRILLRFLLLLNILSRSKLSPVDGDISADHPLDQLFWMANAFLYANLKQFFADEPILHYRLIRCDNDPVRFTDILLG
ncbi:hypothetical protein D3C85_1510910 [compost metagenome]